MKVTKNITIDLNNPRRHVVHLMQGENQREITLTLLKDGMPFDVSEGIGTATLVKGVGYIKANGVPGYYDWTSTDEAAVVAVSGTTNKWTVRLDEHATDVSGFAQIFVKFSLASGETLHSFPVTLDVIRTSGGTTDPDKPYYHSTSFLLAGAQAAKTPAMTFPVGVDGDGKLWAEGGWSAEAKEALLACFEQVAWKTPYGQTYLSALETALYPEVHLTSITAAYEQDRPILDTDSLDLVRLDLIVTANYSNGTSEQLADNAYSLTGTLTVGISTITVGYGGKTANISVLVTSGYQLVEYIENAGDSDSWIELDVVPSNTFGFKANISLAERTSDLFVFGTREIDAGRVLVGANASKKTYVGWGADVSIASSSPAVEWGTMETIKCNYKNDRKAYVNSSDVWGSDLSALGFTPTWNWIVLGFKNQQGAISGRQCKIHKEGIEITDGSNVIRDLRPCYRKSDNAIGLLDVLSNTFYGNSGTGALVKGSDLSG